MSCTSRQQRVEHGELRAICKCPCALHAGCEARLRTFGGLGVRVRVSVRVRVRF